METEASLDGLDGGEGTEENFQIDSLSEQACEGQMHGKAVSYTHLDVYKRQD